MASCGWTFERQAGGRQPNAGGLEEVAVGWVAVVLKL